MEKIKLKECPCCGGEARFVYTFEADTRQVRAKCSKCGLATEWVDESVDYCAKEEAAKVWNRRESNIETCENCGCSCIQTIHEFSFGKKPKTFKKCVECKKITEVKDENCKF